MENGFDSPNLEYPMYCEFNVPASMFYYGSGYIQWENDFNEGPYVDTDRILGEFVEYIDL